MLDKQGKIMDPDSARPTYITFDSKAESVAFNALKFTLQYEDFFDGRHLLVIADKNNPGKSIIAHRCGGTVFRMVSNVDIGFVHPTREGFYSFMGDNGECLFPEMWKDNIKISLRCRLTDAIGICRDYPDYEAASEWLSIMDHMNDIPTEPVEMCPCNPFENEFHANDNRDYCGSIVLSKFVGEVYSMVGDGVFFNLDSVKMFFDPEAKYSLLGDRKDTIFMQYVHENGVTENTLIYSMDEKHGIFDYERFNSSK